jgi:hypothetical protein
MTSSLCNELPVIVHEPHCCPFPLPAQEKEDVEAKKAKSYAGNRVVVLVSDNAATQIAVQLLMAVLKPGKEHGDVLSLNVRQPQRVVT